MGTMDNGNGADDAATNAFNRALGDRLRKARQRTAWSLNDVEAMTDGEFKASVLGAYERGERSLSVSRLCRLCDLYGVEPTLVLPVGRGAKPVRVDLDAAAVMPDEQAEVMQRFLDAIQTMRTEAGDPGLAVRESDLTVLSALVDTRTPTEALELLVRDQRR